jgi:hypothetical protein
MNVKTNTIKNKLQRLKLANSIRQFVRNLFRIEDLIDDKLYDIENDVESLRYEVDTTSAELDDRPTHYDLEVSCNDLIHQYIEDNIEDIAEKIAESNKSLEVKND